jgi:hypothetical protein
MVYKSYQEEYKKIFLILTLQTKEGCNTSPSAERFTFVRCEAMSKVQKRHSLPKSDRNAPRNPDFGL